jgi:hypothetical protein
MAVEGLGKLLRKMELIPKRAIKAAEQSLEQSADQIVAMMRRLVPKDQGALARSIGWTWGEAPKGSLVLGAVASGGGNERAYASLKITIYAGDATTIVKNSHGGEFQNALIQEFGTKAMPANPYFFPSWRASKSRAKAKLTRDIRRAIEKG